MGGGGHRGGVSISVDEKDLKQIINDLDKLFPDSDTKLRNNLRTGMRKAMKPLQTYLRNLIPARTSTRKVFGRGDRVNPDYRGKQGGSPGQLKKSIQIINGKTSRGRKPAVYVGPKVKGGNWNKVDKTGFYFYFWEYGHHNPLTGKYEQPRRWLDKTAQAKGGKAMNDVINQDKEVIARRWAKKLG